MFDNQWGKAKRGGGKCDAGVHNVNGLTKTWLSQKGHCSPFLGRGGAIGPGNIVMTVLSLLRMIWNSRVGNVLAVWTVLTVAPSRSSWVIDSNSSAVSLEMATTLHNPMS